MGKIAKQSHSYQNKPSLPEHELTFLPWLIWSLGASFYFYEFFLQVSPSVMAHSLMASFSINGEQVGNFAAIYFYAYASMQIPVGMLLDRFGPRKLITIAALTCALGNAVIAISPVFLLAEFGRLLIGLGSSFSVVSTLKLAANWFPSKRFAFLTGLMLTVGMSGAIFGEAPLALLVNAMGWRSTTWLLAFIGVALATLIFLIVRDKPKVQMPKYSGLQDESSELAMGLKQLLIYLKGILTNKQNWITAIYGGFMFAPTSAFGAFWGVPFLVTAYNIDQAEAATLISLIFIGWAVGSPVFGALSDRIGRRKPPLYAASFGALLFICLTVYVYSPIWLLGTYLFCFGFFSSGFLPAFSIIRENNIPQSTATALGFMNCMNMIGGATLQPLIGYLLDLRWHHKLVNGVMVFSVDNYRSALLVLPSCIILSMVFLPFVKDTYAKLTISNSS